MNPSEQSNAMMCPDGSLMFPDSLEDARLFWSWHDARPVDPDRWPWPCGRVGLHNCWGQWKNHGRES